MPSPSAQTNNLDGSQLSLLRRHLLSTEPQANVHPGGSWSTSQANLIHAWRRWCPLKTLPLHSSDSSIRMSTRPALTSRLDMLIAFKVQFRHSVVSMSKLLIFIQHPTLPSHRTQAFQTTRPLQQQQQQHHHHHHQLRYCQPYESLKPGLVVSVMACQHRLQCLKRNTRLV